MNTHAYIIFELGGSAYGVRSDEVQHVDLLESITPVPNTAPAVEGVVFSRGRVVPALNLRTRFGLPRAPHTPSTRLLYLQVEDRLVAVIVDAAREFSSVPADSIRPVEDTLHGIEGNYVRGVATVKGRLVLLLDVQSLLKIGDLPASAATPVRDPQPCA